MDTFTHLYGERTDWLPILAFRRGDAISWAPKAEVGNAPWLDAEAVGVWGGMVRSYGVGFNHQPVLLTFASIDIDAKDNPGVDVPTAVAVTLPDHMVRRSSSGRGAHVFIRLQKQVEYPTRREALVAARSIATTVSHRLVSAGIRPDIVGSNMLWVAGGKQETIHLGKPVDLEPGPIEKQSAPTKTQCCIALNGFGPVCRSLVRALAEDNIVPANEELRPEYRVNLHSVQRAWRDLPLCPPAVLGVYVPGEYRDANKTDSILSFSGGEMRLYTFIAGAGMVLVLPTFC